MKQRFSKRTRLVSALLTLAMVFTFLPFSALAATGDDGIPIDADHFPDEAFRNYLLSENRNGTSSYSTPIKIDTDQNGILSEAERNAVKEIDVYDGYNGQKITSLKGIEFFPNLEGLFCSNNNLTSLDVSKNTALKRLWCEENNLTSLDVSQNTQLKVLDCHQNNLTSLNVESTNIDKPYSQFDAQNNTYPITVRSNRAFDLSTLPGGFDASKASGWVGGTEKDNILTVNEGANQVTYTTIAARAAMRPLP